MSTLGPPTAGSGELHRIALAARHGDRDAAWRRLKNAALALGVIYAVSLAAFGLLAYHFETGLATPIAAALLLLAIFAIVIRSLPGHPHERFGPANIITAIRASLTSFFGAAVLFAEPAAEADPLLTWLIVIVIIALALDGIDGNLARRTGLQSSLGTRFDMEVDALLILLLSVAAFLLGKAGIWVLAIGLMRYGFVLGQICLPFLTAPLPPSFLRKLICVVQVAALCLILAPAIAPPVSTAIAATALVLITYSFGVDVFGLARRRYRRP